MAILCTKIIDIGLFLLELFEHITCRGRGPILRQRVVPKVFLLFNARSLALLQ